MNPQFVRKGTDKAAVRQQYLNNLKLEESNNQLNWNANQLYKSTGQSNPQALPDNRTTTEKRADLERMKVELRSEFKNIADGQVANDIVEKLSPDELRFTAQQIKFIMDDLKPRYSDKSAASAPVQAYIRKLMRKYTETKGIEYGLQQDTFKGVAADQTTLLQNLPDKAFIATQIQRLKEAGVNDRGLFASMTTVAAAIPDEQALSLLDQITAEAAEGIWYKLNEASTTIPSRDIIEELINEVVQDMAYGGSTAGKELGELEQMIYNSKEGTSIFAEAAEELDAIAAAEAADGLLGAEEDQEDAATATSGSADYEALMNPNSPAYIGNDLANLSGSESDEDETASAADWAGGGSTTLETGTQQTGAAVPDINPTPATWVIPTPARAKAGQWDKGTKLAWLNHPAIKPQWLYVDTGKKVTTNSTQMSNEKLASTNADDLAQKAFNPETRQATFGFGLRKNLQKRIMPKMRTLQPPSAAQPLHQNGGEGFKRIEGKGLANRIAVPIKKEAIKPYHPFGRFYIHKPKLEEGIMQLRTEGGSVIKGFPSQQISSKMVRILKQISGGGFPEFDDLNDLHITEKKSLGGIIRAAHLADRVSVPKPDLSKERQELDKFNILKGEIAAGNDNRGLVKEFKIMLMKFVNEGRVPRRQAHEILTDLAAQGL